MSMDTRSVAGFRGWWIVAVGFFTQAVALGFSLFSFSLFVPSLMEEFQGSRAVVTLGFSLMFSGMTLVGPFVGRMLDTRSVRGLMVTGAVINASCLALMSRATELWQLGILFGGGVAIGTAMLGPLASATVVTRWFDQQRGRAQGLVNMGGPAGGLLGAPLGGYLLQTLGWRSTVLVFSATTLIVIPAIWLVIRNRPEDLGQAPDGVARDPTPQDVSATTGVEVEPGEWTTVGMFRFSGLWLLGLAIAAIASTGSGWGANLAVYAGDLGIGIAQVAIIVGLSAGMGVVGTAALGFLADKIDQRLLLGVIVAAHIVAFVIFQFEVGYVELMLTMGLIGMAGGGLMPVYATLVARVFGQASFGQALGLIGLIVMPFSFVAAPLAGAVRDRTGSYDTALLIYIGFLIVAGAGLSLLKNRRATAR